MCSSSNGILFLQTILRYVFYFIFMKINKSQADISSVLLSSSSLPPSPEGTTKMISRVSFQSSFLQFYFISIQTSMTILCSVFIARVILIVFYTCFCVQLNFLSSSIISIYKEKSDSFILTTLWYSNLQLFNIFICPQIDIMLFPIFSVLKTVLPHTSLRIYRTRIMLIGKHLKSLITPMSTI